MKINLYICLMVLLVSCNSNLETGHEPFLEANDSFVDQPLGFEVSEFNLLANFPKEFKATKSLIQNRHTTDLMDTLIEFESIGSVKDYFLMYKTLGKEIFMKATIRTNSLLLKNTIKVGMSKKDFTEQLKVETQSDIIKVCDIEQTKNWIFYFSKSRLDSIVYQGYVD